MKLLTLWHIDVLAWYTFGGFWLIAWLQGVHGTKVREKSSDRLLTVAVVVSAFELLFNNWPRITVLEQRFVPDDLWVRCAAVGLTWLGIAVAIWARVCIGEFWSARVTLKEGHQLIRSGPYAFVRHPIYTGMLLGAAGTAVLIGEWRGLLAVALLLAAHSRKAMREEALLKKEFGEQYGAYRQTTGFLFPRLSRPTGMDSAA